MSSVQTPTVKTPDFEGPVHVEPEPRTVQINNVLLGIGPFLITMELFERLGYYSITGNMVALLRQPAYGMEPARISALKSCFTSFLYAMCLVGGYLADARLGRYKTILYFALLYAVGMIFASAATLPGITSTVIFFVGLFCFVSPGSGAIKPNMIVLGGDQFDESDPAQAQQKVTFFNYYYWAIQIGATIAFGPLPFLGENGIPALGIDAEFGYTVVFFLGAFCMCCAVLLFYAGRGRYIKYPPQGSVLADFVSVMLQAAKYSMAAKLVCTSTALIVVFFSGAMAGAFLTGDTVRVIVSSISAVGVIILCLIFILMCRKSTWMDNCRKANGGSLPDHVVDAAAQYVELFPFLGCLIIWQAIYDQMNGQFFNQTFQFDLRFTHGEVTCVEYIEEQDIYQNCSPELPGQVLNLANTLVILIGIPILDTVIYPAIHKIKGSPITPLQRFGTGFFIGTLSMLYSGLVEIMRRNAGPLTVPEGMEGAGEPVYGMQNAIMNDISFWWAMPQYVIVGMAEAFINTTAMDFFYAEAPKTLKSLSQASQLFCTTPGSVLSGAVASIFAKYTPSNLNEGHQEYLYFFLTILGTINVFVFLVISRPYVYKYGGDDEVDEKDTRMSLASSAAGGLHRRSSIINQK